MATNVNLTDDTTTYELDSDTSYGFPYLGLNLSTPTQDLVWGSSRGSDFDRLAAVTFRNRQVSGSIRVRGTTIDNWVTAYRNLIDMLYESMRYWQSGGFLGTRCYLDVQLAAMTNSTRFDVLAGNVDVGNILLSFPMLKIAAAVSYDIPITLTCKPFGRNSALTTSTSGLLDNYGGAFGVHIIAAATVVGDWDPPCKVTFQPAAGDDLRRLILYRRSKGTVANFVSVFEGELATYTNVDGTSTDYAVTDVSDASVDVANIFVGATARDGKALRVTSAALGATDEPVEMWEITSNNNDYEGDFRVWVRWKLVFANRIDTVHIRYGGDNGNDITLADVNAPGSTGFRMADLGKITIPHRALPQGQALPNFKMRLYCDTNVSTTGDAFDVDYIHLVPIDEDILDVEFSANLSALDKVILDANNPVPILLITDSAGVAQPETKTVYRNTFFKQRVRAANIWGFIAMDGPSPHTHDIADDAVLTVEWYAQYALNR